MRAAWQRRGYRSRPVPTALGRLHFFSAPGGGEAPPILALHGFGSSGLTFMRTLERLRPSVRGVACLDGPGHGFSDLPATSMTVASWRDAAVEAFDEVTGRGFGPRPMLIGNSLGGAMAISLARMRPGQTSALVLCAPAGAPLTEAEHGALSRLFELRSRAEAQSFLHRLFSRPPWFAALLAPTLRSRLTRPHLRRFLESVTAIDAFDEAELMALDVPTLVLWGDADGILPESAAAFFARAAGRPGSPLTFERLAGVGHSPQIECPVALARRVLAFMNRDGKAPDVPGAPVGLQG